MADLNTVDLSMEDRNMVDLSMEDRSGEVLRLVIVECMLRAVSMEIIMVVMEVVWREALIREGIKGGRRQIMMIGGGDN